MKRRFSDAERERYGVKAPKAVRLSGKNGGDANGKMPGNNMSNREYRSEYYRMLGRGKSSLRRRRKKILIIVTAAVLSLVIIPAAIFGIFYLQGRRSFSNRDVTADMPGEVETEDYGRVVIHNGNRYVFNENVSTVLFIGVDNETATQIRSEIRGASGQADALFLFVMDNDTGRYTVISINRDSMVSIDRYTVDGQYVGQITAQICLSFSYGDGGAQSSEMTSQAVSRLLMGMPVNSFFSVNKASIPIFNDLIGGVEVPIYDDDGEPTGERVHLMGRAAYYYLYQRDVTRYDSGLVRQTRQLSYITAFSQRFVSATRENITTPVSMFNAMSDYATTDLGVTRITYLATRAFLGRADIGVEIKTVPGQLVPGADNYAQFEVDNEALLELVLDVFYNRVNS